MRSANASPTSRRSTAANSPSELHHLRAGGDSRKSTSTPGSRTAIPSWQQSAEVAYDTARNSHFGAGYSHTCNPASQEFGRKLLAAYSIYFLYLLKYNAPATGPELRPCRAERSPSSRPLLVRLSTFRPAIPMPNHPGVLRPSRASPEGKAKKELLRFAVYSL